MILLDTNALSALMQSEADRIVVAWLDSQPPESIWTTSIMLEEDFEGRVVPFDEGAAQSAVRIAAERRRLGRSIEIRDVQIAGIAATRKAAIATRNVRHFRGLGPDLIDPWSV